MLFVERVSLEDIVVSANSELTWFGGTIVLDIVTGIKSIALPVGSTEGSTVTKIQDEYIADQTLFDRFESYLTSVLANFVYYLAVEVY